MGKGHPQTSRVKLRELCPTCPRSLPPCRPREMPPAPRAGRGQRREGAFPTSERNKARAGPGGTTGLLRERSAENRPRSARRAGDAQHGEADAKQCPKTRLLKKKPQTTAPQRQPLAPSTSCASGPSAAPSSRSEIPALPAAPGGPPAPAPPPSIARAHWSVERGPLPPSRPSGDACWEV